MGRNIYAAEPTFNARVFQSKTADYTVLHTDDQVQVTCSSADLTMTLPTIADLAGNMKGSKAVKIIKKDNTGYRVTITPASGEKVDGVANRSLYLIYDEDYVILKADVVNGNWEIDYSTLEFAEQPLAVTYNAGTLTSSTEYHAVNFRMYSTVSSGSMMVTLDCRCEPIGGTNASWMTAAFFRFKMGSTMRSQGYFCAAEFEVDSDVTGTTSDYGIIVLNSIMDNNQANGCYIWLHKYGDQETRHFLRISDITVGTNSGTALFSSTTARTHTHSLHIMVGTSGYWIMCTNQSP